MISLDSVCGYLKNSDITERYDNLIRRNKLHLSRFYPDTPDVVGRLENLKSKSNFYGNLLPNALIPISISSALVFGPFYLIGILIGETGRIMERTATRNFLDISEKRTNQIIEYNYELESKRDKSGI